MHPSIPHSPCAPSHLSVINLNPDIPTLHYLSAPPKVYASVLTAGLPVGAEDEVQASIEGVHLSDSSGAPSH